jgi:AcrR family transcriptional regulator
MPPRPRRPPARRLTAEQRRAVLLACARTLFAERGYAATSIEDVAAAAGVTKPVVYDHFASKKDLYVALMLQLRDLLLEDASQALATAAAPQQRLRSAIEQYFQMVKRDPAIVRLLFTQPMQEPELMREWERMQAEAIGQLRPLLRAVAPKLESWQLTVALHLLHHGLNATAQAWPRNASPKQMADLVVALLWKGLETFK